MKDSSLSKFVTILGVVGSLVCINILAVQNFVRLDLTADSTFTLAEASEKTMRDLEDPVAITAYFTENLPPPFSQNAQFVRDLLEEYRVASGAMVSYEFIDPQGEETEEDKEVKKDVKQDFLGRRIREQTSIEKELASLGISPVEIRVIEEDTAQTKRAYMGIVVRYQEETEAIPVIQETSSLEYNLTTLIRNLTRTRVPVLGITQGHGEASLAGEQPNEPGELDQLKTLLEQLYEVRPLDLKSGLEDGKIPSDFDALMMVGPREAFSEESLKAIDAFITEGKSAAFYLDGVDVDMRTFQISPVDTGIGALLATYGVEAGPQLVADAAASSLMVTRQMGVGGRQMRVQMPLPYPFVPALRVLEQDSPITRGIADVSMPFVTPLFVNDDVPTAKKADDEAAQKPRYARVLARSSAKSWLEDATPQNLSPQRFADRFAAPDVTGPYDLAVTVQGALPSHYGNAVEQAEPKEGETKQESRVVVVGTSGLIKSQFLSQSNAALALNIVDWMLLDPSILSMRTRGLVEAPIDPELSDGTRTALKWGNVVGLQIALLILGLALWQAREARRKKLAVV